MCQAALPAGMAAAAFAPASVAVEPAIARPAPIYLATDLSRATATLIDVLQMLFSSVLWVALMWNVPISVWLKVLGAWVLLWGPAFLDAGSGSLGRRCLKIQLVTTQGRRPSLVVSLWRHTVKYVVNLSLPVVWKLIEAHFTGGRHLHDVLASTTVIARAASGTQVAAAAPEAFHEVLMAQARGGQAVADGRRVVSGQDLQNARQQTTATSRAYEGFKTVLAWVIAGCLLWLFGQAAWSLYQESQNPAMAAISDAKTAAKPLTKLLAQRYEQGQSMDLDWTDPALAALEAEMGKTFNSVAIEPRGPVVLQMRAGPLAGRHIVLMPEFNWTKKSVKKWKCGSPDIERTLLPTGCKAVWDGLQPAH